MAKRLTYILILSLLAAGCNRPTLFGAGFTKPSSQSAPDTHGAVYAVPNSPTAKTKEVKQSTAMYRVDLRFPVISALQDLQTQKDVNQSIEHIVAQLNADVEPRTDAEKKYILRFRRPYELIIDYKIYQLTPRYLSVAFMWLEDTNGVHPNHGTKTLNYDLKQNTEIHIQDIWAPGTNYAQILSYKSRAELKRQIKVLLGADYGSATEGTAIDAGAPPDPKSFPNFVFTAQGIEFFFDPYQIGAYALGDFKVLLSYAELGDVLSPEIKSEIATFK